MLSRMLLSIERANLRSHLQRFWAGGTLRQRSPKTHSRKWLICTARILRLILPLGWRTRAALMRGGPQGQWHAQISTCTHACADAHLHFHPCMHTRQSINPCVLLAGLAFGSAADLHAYVCIHASPWGSSYARVHNEKEGSCGHEMSSDRTAGNMVREAFILGNTENPASCESVGYSLVPCISTVSAEYVRLLEPNLAQEVQPGAVYVQHDPATTASVPPFGSHQPRCHWRCRDRSTHPKCHHWR